MYQIKLIRLSQISFEMNIFGVIKAVSLRSLSKNVHILFLSVFLQMLH